MTVSKIDVQIERHLPDPVTHCQNVTLSFHFVIFVPSVAIPLPAFTLAPFAAIPLFAEGLDEYGVSALRSA
jgi:hypothetical protein